MRHNVQRRKIVFSCLGANEELALCNNVGRLVRGGGHSDCKARVIVSGRISISASRTLFQVPRGLKAFSDVEKLCCQCNGSGGYGGYEEGV